MAACLPRFFIFLFFLVIVEIESVASFFLSPSPAVKSQFPHCAYVFPCTFYTYSTSLSHPRSLSLSLCLPHSILPLVRFSLVFNKFPNLTCPTCQQIPLDQSPSTSFSFLWSHCISQCCMLHRLLAQNYDRGMEGGEARRRISGIIFCMVRLTFCTMHNKQPKNTKQTNNLHMHMYIVHVYVCVCVGVALLSCCCSCRL